MAREEKIRYLRLKQVFDKALNQSISTLKNWEKVSACFPEYASNRENATNLSNCQSQVIEFWTEICKREFEDILKERNVKEKLDELDELISEARERLRNLPRDDHGNGGVPSIDELSSAQLIDCNLYTQRINAAKELDKRLDKLNKINQHLEDKLEQLDCSIESEKKELSCLYDRFIGKSVDTMPDETLAQGLNDMLQELSESQSS
ncbi:NNF1 (YJR112W) [Zygosaccharomyces parabailii]|nr:NNF1 (YJR112W) [Zygosaccharomyces parabailii]CDH16493.1 related to Kinetochore-associated protein NNF1 [Zygosaccharomyces bailii ISA1307]SJM84672.1 related to Kinetochore-associated protein NNF1 [Zygosaccharomyces bailii]